MKVTPEKPASSTVGDLLKKQEEDLKKWIADQDEKILFKFNEALYRSIIADYEQICRNRNIILAKYNSLLPDYAPLSHTQFEKDIIPLHKTYDDEKISAALKLLWLDHQGAGFNLKIKGKDILLKATAAPTILEQFNMDYPQEITDLASSILLTSKLDFPYGISPSFSSDKYVIDEPAKSQIHEFSCTYYSHQQLQDFILARNLAKVLNELQDRGIGFNSPGEIPHHFKGIENLIEWDPYYNNGKLLENARPIGSNERPGVKPPPVVKVYSHKDD